MSIIYCGAGRADITLPTGTPMGGFANRLSPCQGSLDPLSARVLALSQGYHHCLIVTLDALAISVERARALCALCAQVAGEASPFVSGLAAVDVRICCSHTHSGADLSGMFGDGGQLTAYYEQVVNAVLVAVREACAALTPATVRQAVTQLPIGRNRRLRPGHAQVTELERAQGAQIDNTLTVLRFMRSALRDGEATCYLIATLFHTACHPVCLGPENTQASGDYAGIAAQLIEAQTGAPALFLNGAAGNVTPLIGRGSSYAATCGLAQAVAAAVADAALVQTISVTAISASELRGTQPALAQLPLACHWQTPADVEQAAAWLRQQDTGFTGWLAVVEKWRGRMLQHLAAGTMPEAVDIPLSATRIGGTTFVFIGAEVFNEYQLWQPAGVRLVSYTNGEGCYIPTAAALAGGGYEVNTSPVFYGLPCAPGEGAERVLLGAIARQVTEAAG